MRGVVSRGHWIGIGLLFGAWTGYGALCAWQTHYWYSFTRTPMSWGDCFRYELTYSYLWGLCTPLILWLAKRFRFERGRWPRNLLIHALAMAVIVAATKVLFDLIGNPPDSPFRQFTWPKLFRSVESTFDTGPLLYAVVLLVEHAIIYYARYQSGLVHASQLQTQLMQAQLQALKMRLHPHFLFNALHTVQALVHEDPDAAERTIAKLGELLRLFLANSAVHEIPLSEELRILDLYLEIEKTRFEERLQISYDVPDSLRDAMVPNLVLQPIIENSIRHGLGKRSGTGRIKVAAELAGGKLVLRVSDNGAGLGTSAAIVHRGMGLAITRGRLETLYGPNQSLALRNLAAGGAEASIVLPFRAQAITSQEKDHVELQSTDR